MNEDEGMTIIEFLDARIGEDEELARAASVGMHGKHEDAWDWGGYVLGADRDSTPKQDEFITAWWPKRVLAECAAKRVLIEEHGLMEVASLDRASWGQPFTVCRVCAIGARQVVAPCPTVKAVAAVYKDHPDYKQEWEV